MQDIGLFLTGICADLVIENGDLKADDGLETAVLISLFTNRRVTEEELPLFITDKMGWWADEISEIEDDPIGSKIWVLERAKILPDTAARLEGFAQEALNWLIEDGIAESIQTLSEIIANERIDLEIRIFRPPGDDIPFKFIWDGQELKGA